MPPGWVSYYFVLVLVCHVNLIRTVLLTTCYKLDSGILMDLAECITYHHYYCALCSYMLTKNDNTKLYVLLQELCNLTTQGK